MKTTAAVLVQPNAPLELAELEVPALQTGQVLVEIAFSGVCRTQLLECRGHRGEDPYLPHCLGHEGSGIVREIGTGVTKCKPDDRVILSWMKGSGQDVPGTVYDWDGRRVNAGGVTSFARHSVVSENRIVVIRGSIELRYAAFLGCAVPTGAGAVFHTAAVRRGQSVAVFGTGGIGLCSVMAAASISAAPIIAVDVNRDRLEAASQAGATHLIDASTTDSVAAIRDICSDGIDVSIEATGRPAVMLQALAAVRSRGGAAIIVGNARHGERIDLDPAELNQGKRLLGTWGGDNQPDRDFPRYEELVAGGAMNLQPLLSEPYPLSQINQALEDLECGHVVRPIVDMNL
jgi:S-(hydroxymethyl)glutathione dehydrogenase/alcohol dehydrogenase